MYRQQNNNMYFQENLKDTISVHDHAMVLMQIVLVQPTTGKDQAVNLYINILP